MPFVWQVPIDVNVFGPLICSPPLENHFAEHDAAKLKQEIAAEITSRKFLSLASSGGVLPTLLSPKQSFGQALASAYAAMGQPAAAAKCSTESPFLSLRVKFMARLSIRSNSSSPSQCSAAKWMQVLPAGTDREWRIVLGPIATSDANTCCSHFYKPRHLSQPLATALAGQGKPTLWIRRAYVRHANSTSRRANAKLHSENCVLAESPRKAA